ncbi:MAG: filamentous hemagglutinin N-terminal domain-containing protein, partial [Elsteraceae bacterium]
MTQSSQKGIIDWRSFSIGPQEAVRFDQPGRSSVTLNRVTGTEASRIDGSLSATGQVWLANPNGVLIGPGGQVNVGGLMATTGRVDAQAFLATGRAQIDQIAKDAAIVNAGQITVGEGGYAALAAAVIRNDGVIAARSGSVALGAGKAMTLDFAGDKLISFQVAQPLDQAPANAEALIANDGLIAARGGNVIISARAAKGVIDNVVNLKGHVISDAVRVDGGTVIFGDGGAVRVSGRIDASRAAGAGGSVTVLGEKVGLMDGAAIDASGATGGGTVLIGGDWQGKGDPGANGQNALVTYVAPTASITAEATQSGVGGKIVVWADDATRFNGQISAPGGKVETSGKKTLSVGATAKVKAGAWLLDPSDITIQPGGTGSLTGGVFDPAGVSTIDPATITAGLTTGDVTIQTSSGAGGSGDITFGGTISTASGTIRTLTLLADRNILITNGTITMTGAAHNVVLNSRASGAAEGAIVIGASTFSTISTTGGTISLVGGVGGAGAARGSAANVNGVVLFSTTLSAGAGAIVVNGTGRLGDSASQIFGVLVQTSTLSANGGITITGGSGDQASVETYGVFTTGSSLTAGGSGSIAITGSAIGSSPTAVGVRVNGAMSLGSGPLNITGSSSGTGQGVISGAPISSAGDVTLQASGSSGDIKIGGTISTTSGTIRTLKLLADRNIEFASGTITMIGTAHDVVLNTRASGAAEGAIFMNGNAL